MLACAAAGILVATAISFAIPVHYLSWGNLILTPGDKPGNLVVNGDLLVAKLARNVFSRESLASVIQKNNLYPRERAAMSLDDVIAKMRSKVSVIPLPVGSPANPDALVFSIRFDYPDPRVAQQVDSELTSRFLESAVTARIHELETQTTAPLPDSHFTFSVLDPPSLPQAPAGPNRTQFAAVGLATGILCGLTLAIAARMRRNTAAQNG